MDLPVNQFKRAMLERQAQVGLWIALASPVTAELCAASGYDWLLIDGEHGPNDVPGILAQLQAVAAYPVHPIVRPPTGEAVLIKQYLDAGAQTLLVPMVETAEQASELVKATRFPPDGMRGVATLTRAARWARIPNYLLRAREEICLVVQIESVRGLDNLESIAAVDGVDALFLGPSDLSGSMGLLGQAGHPEVVAEVERAIARIEAMGKPYGIFTGDEALTRKCLASGAFAALGSDAILLAKAADALRSQF